MDRKDLEEVYRVMLRIRRFDEGVAALFKDGLVKGTAHSYVGQEAVAAGACAALTRADFVVSHHRGHGHCIAKGASLEDPAGLFNASLDGNVRRAIDIREDDSINEAALQALIRAAVALNASTRAARSPRKPKRA